MWLPAPYILAVASTTNHTASAPGLVVVYIIWCWRRTPSPGSTRALDGWAGLLSANLCVVGFCGRIGSAASAAASHLYLLVSTLHSAHLSAARTRRFGRRLPSLPKGRYGSSAKHLTMRWSERRTAVRSTFEMTSTRSLRATRALVRRRSSCSR